MATPDTLLIRGSLSPVSFAPTTEQQFGLLRYLTKRFGHVSIERVCSGPSIVHIYDFLRNADPAAEYRASTAGQSAGRNEQVQRPHTSSRAVFTVSAAIMRGSSIAEIRQWFQRVRSGGSPLVHD